MTPSEALLAIKDGKAKDLMLNLRGAATPIFVLSPANNGRGGMYAPGNHLFSFLTGYGDCIFLKNKRCAIHASGYKPIECRHLSCATGNGMARETIKVKWDTPFGRAVVARWKETVGMTE